MVLPLLAQTPPAPVVDGKWTAILLFGVAVLTFVERLIGRRARNESRARTEEIHRQVAPRNGDEKTLAEKVEEQNEVAAQQARALVAVNEQLELQARAAQETREDIRATKEQLADIATALAGHLVWHPGPGPQRPTPREPGGESSRRRGSHAV